MSPNHKDQTNLYNWKKISQGKSVSCALCIFLLCSSLKWNKEYPKAICHFGSENTEAEEKKLPSMGFLFFPKWHILKYFPINLAQPWDEGSGWFLTHLTSRVHLYWQGNCCSAPRSPPPWCKTEVLTGALWIRASRRCWVCLFSVTSALRIGMQGTIKRGNSFSQKPFFPQVK